MIVVTAHHSAHENVESVVSHIRERGLSAQLNEGVERTVIGLMGEDYEELQDELAIMPGVIEDFRISKPYKLASREFHDTDTIVHIGESRVTIGAGHFTVFARPCSREIEKQTAAMAKAVKKTGARVLVSRSSHRRLPTASKVCSKTD